MIAFKVVLPQKILVDVDCDEPNCRANNGSNLGVQMELHPLLVVDGSVVIRLKQRNGLREQDEKLEHKIQLESLIIQDARHSIYTHSDSHTDRMEVEQSHTIAERQYNQVDTETQQDH